MVTAESPERCQVVHTPEGGGPDYFTRVSISPGKSSGPAATQGGRNVLDPHRRHHPTLIRRSARPLARGPPRERAAPSVVVALMSWWVGRGGFVGVSPTTNGDHHTLPTLLPPRRIPPSASTQPLRRAPMAEQWAERPHTPTLRLRPCPQARHLDAWSVMAVRRPTLNRRRVHRVARRSTAARPSHCCVFR